MTKKDLSGQRFGKLLIIRRLGVDRNKKILWECVCDCGTTKSLRGNDLSSRKIASCGCSGKGKLNDLTGKRYGKLVVLRRFGEDRNKKVLWECACDCGVSKNQRGNDLESLKVSSCGCEQYGVGERANAYKHGMSQSKIRWVWSAMKDRCTNPSNASYSRYGGRGIQVDKAWHKFEDFLEDMGEPERGMSINRVNNDGNYCKENCVWSSMLEQCENRRNTRFLTINSETKPLLAWSTQSGIPYRTILARLKRGWDAGDAVFFAVVKGDSREDELHWLSKSPIYRAWVSMRSRCRNPREPYYQDYGGRGITVHPDWESFEIFRRDMGERPEGMSLDRKNTDGDYEPGNCRWVNQTEQIRNRRITRKLTIDGITKSIAEWSEISGIKLVVIATRIKRGWEIQRAVFEPLNSGR